MSTASDRLAAYLAAETAILSGGQETSGPDGRKLREADLPSIQAMIRELQQQVAAETRAASGASPISFLAADFSGRCG